MRLSHRITLSALAALPLLAAWPAQAGDAIDRIVRRDQLTLGYRTDAVPFSYHDAKGRPIGYSVDICRAIAERIKADLGKPALRLRVQAVDADQQARLVSSGGVDLMCAGTSDTEERRRSMDFSSPIFLSQVKFIVRDKAKYSSAAQLKGQTVAVIGRTTAEPAVLAYSTQGGLDLKVSRVVSSEAAFSQLELGQVAAHARDEILLFGQRARTAQSAGYAVLPEAISVERIAIAMPRGDADLNKMVQQALVDMAKDGRLNTLYEKWFVQLVLPGRKEALGLPMSAELKAEFDRLR